MYRIIGTALIITLALSSGVVAEQDQPTLLRTISTGQYRSAVTSADGSALVVKKDGVILRDPAGGTRFVTRLRGNQRVVQCESGRVFGVSTFADNAPSTLHVIRFDVYDRDGTRRFRIDKPAATEFRLSGDGRWTVGIAGGDGMMEARLYLYDGAGEERATWTVPHLSHLTLPLSGTRFFAASRGELLAYPYDGSEPQRLGRFEAFATSDNGRHVTLCGAGSVFLMNESGLVFSAKSSVTAVRSAAVSPDGRYVAVVGGDRLEMFGSEERDLIWTVTSSGEPDLRFISVALSVDPWRVLCGLDRDPGVNARPEERHNGGAVFLFGKDGVLQWREELSYQRWNFKVPAVAFKSADGQIEVRLADEHRQYRLP